ncbi:MAG TPA: VCBS domain-containing protein, partial [Pseudomonadales bacterium]|nr:VCBS domain-containing protein [Pseudomonadales bacterium]
QQTFTVTLVAANDTPEVTGQLTGSVNEGNVGDITSVTGSLAISDRDAADSPSFADVTSMAGANNYGSFSLSSGTWTYTLDQSAVQNLDAGDIVTDTFAFEAKEGSTTVETQVVTVTINGTNDVPTLTAPTAISFTDNDGDDTFSDRIGTLDDADFDTHDSELFAIFGQSADSSRNGYDVSKAGRYGTLYLNSSTGAYLYAPSDAAIEAATGTVSEQFSVSVTDSQGASASQTLTINVIGANDSTIVTAYSAGSDTATLEETNSALTVKGALTVSDLDVAQTVDVSVAEGTKQLTDQAASALTAEELAWLTFASATALNDSQDTSRIEWTFNSANEAFDYLRAGDVLVLSYTARFDDGVTPVDKSITITIKGTNDRPDISVEAGDLANGGLTETNDSSRTLSGTLSVSDPELGDTVSLTIGGLTVSGTAPVAARPTSAALLSMLTLSTDTILSDDQTLLDANGLTWTFNSGAEAFDELAAGETLVLDYAIRATDNANIATGIDTQVVRITITGSVDAPVISYSATTSEKPDAGDDIADALQGFIVSGDQSKMSATGSLSFTDIDVSDTPTATIEAIDHVNTSITATARFDTDDDGELDVKVLTNDQKQVIFDAFSITQSSDNTVNWLYSINQTDLDFLGSGERVNAVFSLLIDDGNGGLARQTVTIQLLGKNNAPVIRVGAEDADSAQVTEPVGDVVVSATDTLTVFDSNFSDTVIAEVVSGQVSYRGGSVEDMSVEQKAWLTLDANPILDTTLDTKQMNWTFNAGSEYFHELAEGETAVFTYLIRVTDDAPDGT